VVQFSYQAAFADSGIAPNMEATALAVYRTLERVGEHIDFRSSTDDWRITFWRRRRRRGRVSVFPFIGGFCDVRCVCGNLVLLYGLAIRVKDWCCELR
jgi:hypothetical protein